MGGAGGVAAVVAATLAVAVALVSGNSGAPQDPLGRSCAEIDESTFETETLRDLRSYSEAIAIVRGLKEEIPPAPCGPGRLAPTTLTLSAFSAARRGAFAFGRGGERVAELRGRFHGGETIRAPTLPTPIPPGGNDRFWVAPARGDCPLATIRALDVNGRVLEERTAPRLPAPPPGKADPCAACPQRPASWEGYPRYVSQDWRAEPS